MEHGPVVDEAAQIMAIDTSIRAVLGWSDTAGVE